MTFEEMQKSILPALMVQCRGLEYGLICGGHWIDCGGYRIRVDLVKENWRESKKLFKDNIKN